MCGCVVYLCGLHVGPGEAALVGGSGNSELHSQGIPDLSVFLQRDLHVAHRGRQNGFQIALVYGGFGRRSAAPLAQSVLQSPGRTRECFHLAQVFRLGPALLTPQLVSEARIPCALLAACKGLDLEANLPESRSICGKRAHWLQGSRRLEYCYDEMISPISLSVSLFVAEFPVVDSSGPLTPGSIPIDELLAPFAGGKPGYANKLNNLYMDLVT